MRRMLFVLGTGAAALVLFTFAPTGDASRLKSSGTAIHDVSTTAKSRICSLAIVAAPQVDQSRRGHLWFGLAGQRSGVLDVSRSSSTNLHW
jgi:hypothetical protein